MHGKCILKLHKAIATVYHMLIVDFYVIVPSKTLFGSVPAPGVENIVQLSENTTSETEKMSTMQTTNLMSMS